MIIKIHSFLYDGIENEIFEVAIIDRMELRLLPDIRKKNENEFQYNQVTTQYKRTQV